MSKLSDVSSLSVREYQLAMTVPPIQSPVADIRFAGRRGESTLPRGFSSDEIALVQSTVWPRFPPWSFDLTVDEPSAELASSLYDKSSFAVLKAVEPTAVESEGWRCMSTQHVWFSSRPDIVAFLKVGDVVRKRSKAPRGMRQAWT